MIIMEPVGKHCEIKKSQMPSEADIQHLLSKIIEDAGLHVSLEYHMSPCRFDIVVFNKRDKAVAIIELKKHEYRFASSKHSQIYTQFGIPVYFISGMSDVDEFTSKYLNNLDGSFSKKYEHIPVEASSEIERYSRRHSRTTKKSNYEKIGDVLIKN